MSRSTPADTPPPPRRRTQGRPGSSAAPRRAAVLALAMALSGLAAIAVAQHRVSLRAGGGPPPARTVRYGNRALLPSEQRDVAFRSGMMPSQMRDARFGSGRLPNAPVTANAGTMRYARYNHNYAQVARNQAPSSIRYAGTVPGANRPQPQAMPSNSFGSPPGVPTGSGMVSGSIPRSTYRAPTSPYPSGSIRYSY